MPSDSHSEKESPPSGASEVVEPPNLSDNSVPNEAYDKYARHRLQRYKEMNLSDRSLWESMFYDFENWGPEHWLKVRGETHTNIKDYCIPHGIWIRHYGPTGKRHEIVAGLFKNDFFEDWTLHQIQTTEDAYKMLSPRVSSLKERLLANANPTSSHATVVAPVSAVSMPPNPSGSAADQSNSSDRRSEFASQPGNIQASSPVQPLQVPQAGTATGTTSFVRTPSQTPPPSVAFAGMPPIGSLNQPNQSFYNPPTTAPSHRQPPQPPTAGPNVYTYELTQLHKMYKEEDKFSGTGDNFAHKARLFRIKCRAVGLPGPAMHLGAPAMLTGQAINHYLGQAEPTSWEEFVERIESHFEGIEWRRTNLTKWQTMTINDVVAANPNLSLTECLREMTDEFATLQRGLDGNYFGPDHLRENIIRATRSHPAMTNALMDPPANPSALVNRLFTAIKNYEEVHKTPHVGGYVQSYNEDEDWENGQDDEEIFFTDRQYRKGNFHARGRGRGGFKPYRGTDRGSFRSPPSSRVQKCFVCDKPGCWSTNHPPSARDEARKKFGDKLPLFKTRPGFDKVLNQWIIEYEGKNDENHDEINQYFENLLDKPPASPPNDKYQGNGHINPATESFFTFHGTLENSEPLGAASMLADNAFKHHLTHNDQTLPPPDAAPYAFNSSTASRYDSSEFKGLLIDSGAAIWSTGGIGQLRALQRIDNSVIMNTATAGSNHFTFGVTPAPSIGSVHFETPIGQIFFHIVGINTPFLLSLADMDAKGVFLNNTTNQLIQGDRAHSVIRQYGHAFLKWHSSPYTLITESFEQNPCFLTEVELHRLHRRFGHPSVRRLHQILHRAGHQPDLSMLEHLSKYCRHCQLHGRSPGRFSFVIKDDTEFNFNIIVDILYIQGKPVLHVIDEATRFQTGRWLKDISAKHVWDQLRVCWVDTYLGPPDFITADAGKQFVSKEFKLYASTMGTTVKNVPVEAHHSIGQVERYHGPLRRAYEIIIEEVQGIKPESALQMAFKALNDSVGPHGLVPTLLVFGAYPRMSDSDPPAPTLVQRAHAMRRAMDEVRKYNSSRQVQDALNTRNGPSTAAIHDLPLNSPVLVFREGNAGHAGAWRGPFKFLGIDGETALIESPNGPTKFRTTSVKPFFIDPDLTEAIEHRDEATEHPEHRDDHETRPPAMDDEATPLPPPEEGAASNEIPDGEVESEDGIAPTSPIKRGRGRPRKRPIRVNFISPATYSPGINAPPDILFTMDDPDHSMPQFTSSRQNEINGLLDKGVFKLTNPEDVPSGARIFNSRFVDEIKNPGTEKAYEKSRLVVQAYNDRDKTLILTESPTIQRVSQRLIICLAAVLGSDRASLYLRDVTQAYVQSTSELNREFFIRPPPELATVLGAPPDCILKVMKPLYGVPEAGNHWFATYHKHHTERLGMSESTYDSCLLYKNEPFAVVGLQTDDTLILASDEFACDEDEAIKTARIMTKDRSHLSSATPIKFNGAKVEIHQDGSITMRRESPVGGISLIKPHQASATSSRGIVREKLSPKDQYIAQRAKGAYIASICQPEASFDLSYAAQTTVFSSADIDHLNKRLQWQITNQNRGLKFVRLDPKSLQLVVFTDSSFANNRDLSSQIGYVVCLADATNKANILHWSSIKCKRVTRSVLASELYAMAHGFDVGAVIKATLMKVLRGDVPLVLCTDSKSLYDCLVRLGTTQEKRLMIDVMSLRQSYERREITEVKWIQGDSNPADSMTKTKASTALKTLIDTNRINPHASEWVERGDPPTVGAIGATAR